jgi:hypothetical protein
VRSAGRALLLAVAVVVAVGCSLAGRTLGGYVDDKLVKSAVKRRLAGEGVTGLSGVRIDTFGGTVYLSGAVGTAAQKSDAEIAVWRVKGVQQVVNDLVVTRPVAVSTAPEPLSMAPRLPGVTRVTPGLPGGPDLAYDARGRVVASIYTVDWRDVVDAGLATLPPDGRPISRVSTFALPDRPDRPGPQYGVVLWHLSEAEAAALR